MSISNPEVNIQIIPASEGARDQDQKILFLGQQTSAATKPTGKLVKDIGNENEENTYFGENSILASMIRSAKYYNKLTRMDAIPVDDDGAAVAATGTIVFGGTTTVAGTLNITIGSEINHTYAISVVSTDTPTTIGDKLEAAVTADTKVPVTAVNASGTVTLTAINKGEEGNFISFKAVGSVGNITVALTAMSAGATNPDLTSIFDDIQNLRYQTIVFPASCLISDTSNTILNFINNRWNPAGDKILDGVGIFTRTDTLANLKVATYALDTQSFCAIANQKVSSSDFVGSALLEFDYNISSQFAAIRALRLTEDAPISQFIVAPGNLDAFGGIHLATLPYQNTPFSNLPLIDDDLMWLDSERTELKNKQWSILGNNVGNTGIIADMVVTRYTGNAGDPDGLSFKYLNYTDQASVVREYFHNNWKTEYAQTRLSNGDLIPGYNMANSGIIRAFTMKLYRELGELALVIYSEAFRAKFLENLVITINEETGLVEIQMLDLVVTQLRKIDATMKLSFSLND